MSDGFSGQGFEGACHVLLLLLAAPREGRGSEFPFGPPGGPPDRCTAKNLVSNATAELVMCDSFGSSRYAYLAREAKMRLVFGRFLHLPHRPQERKCHAVKNF